MSKVVFLLITLLAVGPRLLLAQKDRETVNQSIQWFALSTSIKLSERAYLLLEGQFRQVANFKPMQYQLRTGLEIKLKNHFSVVPIAYVYTWNYQYGKQPAVYQNHEHRIWQQVACKHSIGIFSVDHRLRPEQRFIQQHSKMPNGDVFDDGYTVNQFRLRYRLMGRLPLNSKEIGAKTFYVSVYDEIFMSWGERVAYSEPDQNRIYAGIGYQFDDAFGLQGGFLYQMLVKSNGAMQENNLGLIVQMNYNVKWSGSL
ncbi:MAG: DUF2490 domain-containing protein [Chryseolinea sp.]